MIFLLFMSLSGLIVVKMPLVFSLSELENCWSNTLTAVTELDTISSTDSYPSITISCISLKHCNNFSCIATTSSPNVYQEFGKESITIEKSPNLKQKWIKIAGFFTILGLKLESLLYLHMNNWMLHFGSKDIARVITHEQQKEELMQQLLKAWTPKA